MDFLSGDEVYTHKARLEVGESDKGERVVASCCTVKKCTGTFYFLFLIHTVSCSICRLFRPQL